MKTVLSLLALFLLASCYTQLLTSADYAPVPARTVLPADSAVLPPDSATPAPPTVSERPAVRSVAPVSSSIDCNCSAWEIQNDICWCTCDRCGYYHRVGYQNCPGGIYRSYWGWDYYDSYPWWSDRYRGRYGSYGRYDRYDHDPYHGSPYYGTPPSSSGKVKLRTDVRHGKERGVVENAPQDGNSLNRPFTESLAPSAGSPTSPSPAPADNSGTSTPTLNTIQPPASSAPQEEIKPVEVKTKERPNKKRGEVE